MSPKRIQDLFPLIQQPSRYLGNEINRIKKDHSKVDLKIALAFPDLYEIGTSHFGMQILYHVLNQQEAILAERVFAPDLDLQALMRQTQQRLRSLESSTELIRFDILGFSLLYELNYTNILTMLELAQIPILASARDGSHPIVIAGGAAMVNPEPVADIFDAIVIGDGEESILSMARTWIQWHHSEHRDKTRLLEMWSRIEGVYIPAFFQAEFDHEGFQHLHPQKSSYRRVVRAIVPDLDRAPFPDAPVVPYGKPVHDRLRLEVARGCSRGCRFCQAGMTYRPVRERSVAQLLQLTQRALANTGYDDVSLLSLSTGDYSQIGVLMASLMGCYAAQHVAVSLPSLRAGTLTPELMELIKQVRKTGFTIAPEAGSQRLRDVINKNITEEEIHATVAHAFEAGWKVIKLYFMIGLPTETQDDLAAIVELVRKLRRIKSPQGRPGKINVSIATFVPKAHTPFQWAAQISLSESQARLTWLKQRLKMPGVQIKWQDPKVSRLEGLWARGDRRLTPLLIKAHQRGCQFDGWTDHFNFDTWTATIAESGVPIDSFTTRPRDLEEPLPWDHIDMRIDKAFLAQEWIAARQGQPTPDCREGDCSNCGTCDFDRIYPRLDSDVTADAKVPVSSLPETSAYHSVRVKFAKEGPAQYFGHLELVNIFTRALRRAQIPVKFSGGFHPMPRLSFEDPIPVGIESRSEAMYFATAVTITPQEIIDRLNRQMPQGLTILECHPDPGPKQRPRKEATAYTVRLREGRFDPDKAAGFANANEFYFTRTNRKGKVRRIDLKQHVLTIKIVDQQNLTLSLAANATIKVRPADVLQHVFGFGPSNVKNARILKH